MGEKELEGGREASRTRRAFLGLMGQAVVVVGVGGLAWLFGSQEDLLRPPGALPESEFVSRCLKCQKCVQVCPTQTIRPVLVTESASRSGTPLLDFRQGYCDLCLKCVEVCPTGALQRRQKQEIRLGLAWISKEKCVAWAWGGCTKCSHECPFGAIAVDDHQRPVIDAARCNGCGLCEHICPSASLRSYTSSTGKGIVVLPLGDEPRAGA